VVDREDVEKIERSNFQCNPTDDDEWERKKRSGGVWMKRGANGFWGLFTVKGQTKLIQFDCLSQPIKMHCLRLVNNGMTFDQVCGYRLQMRFRWLKRRLIEKQCDYVQEDVALLIYDAIPEASTEGPVENMEMTRERERESVGERIKSD
jgi:hypothetical protein